VCMYRQFMLKARDIQTDPCGVFREVSIRQRTLVLEQGVVHREEVLLSGGGFRCFGRVLRVWMDFGGRKVPEYKAGSSQLDRRRG